MNSAARNSVVSTLRLSAAAGEPGPVVIMSGEADASNAAELSDVLTAQLRAGGRA